MVLRETQFLIGGAVVIALGLLLAAGLVWAGAGIEFFGGWLAALLAVGLGAFFVHVARLEAAERRRFLQAAAESDRPAAGRDAPPPP
ncbi:MAG TPA: hypothetical protein VMG99_00400 [Thermoplasmata archaeon]|nr:hypothetical protein [Thermoplasmata archaeon]